MVHEARILKALTILGYTFRDEEYLVEALQAAGAMSVAVRGRFIPEGNKRLALLGDSVLKTMLLHDWYETGGARQVGNDLVCRLVSNKNLADVAINSELKDCIAMNRSQMGQMPGAVVLTSTVEAVIGAVWLDSENDIDVTRYVMQRLGLNA